MFIFVGSEGRSIVLAELGIVRIFLQTGQSISEPDRISSVSKFWPQCGQSKLMSAIVCKMVARWVDCDLLGENWPAKITDYSPQIDLKI